MLTEEQIKERIRLSTITVDENKEVFSIEQCIKALSKEGLEKLYSRYDISDFYDNNSHHSKKNTNSQKIKYLVKEIPGQFIDYYRFMTSKSEQKKIKELCKGKKMKVDYDMLSLADFGFIYFREKNNEIEIIIPYDLSYIVEDLFM